MSTKKQPAKVENPFSQFSVLRGEFPTPENESEFDSDIVTGDEDIVEDIIPTLEDDKDNLSAGDKVIEANIEKAKKIKQGVALEEVLDDSIENVEEDKDLGYKSLISTLVGKSILDVDLEKIEDSEEALELAFTETVDNRINNWVESKNPDFIKFMEFTDNGGDPKDFLNIFYGNHTWEDFKVDNENAQILAAKESLRLSGETPEDIEELVTEWMDNGTLEKRSKSALAKLQKHESIQKDEIVKIQASKAEQSKKANENYWNDFKKDLYSKKDIMGFPLNDKMKDKIWDALTIIDKKSGKTNYQIAVENNKDASLLFALQAVNGFDIKKLEKQVQTKVSNNINTLLKNYTPDSKTRISSGRSEETESSDPFAAFKAVKA